MSTRGSAPRLGFADVLLAGLAADGGLYVPERRPAARCRRGDRRPNGATPPPPPTSCGPSSAGRPGARRVGPHRRRRLPRLRPPRRGAAPPARGRPPPGRAVPRARRWPSRTSPCSWSGRLFDHELARRGERVTVVGATSGDTGSAAIEALRYRDAVDCVILHPRGRVSEVQRRQMTTVARPTTSGNLAVEGTFDDCQDLVKAMFADEPFRRRLRLSAVNSINWARVMAQVVYYVTTAAAARRLGGRARSRSSCPPATSATSTPATSPGAWGCRSGDWSWRRTATTSSPASSPPARCGPSRSCRR